MATTKLLSSNVTTAVSHVLKYNWLVLRLLNFKKLALDLCLLTSEGWEGVKKMGHARFLL